MFNPTVIRLCNTAEKIAMVIANSFSDDVYFQVYDKRFNEKTFLSYTMPWSSELLAIEAFEEWVKKNESLTNQKDN
jgi:hypothetical protein